MLPVIAAFCAHSVVAQFMSVMPAPMGAALIRDRRVVFDDLPPQHIAFNPSMVRYHGQTIMVFRRDDKPGAISRETQLAVVPLDADFQPTQRHQVLDTRVSATALHAGEDPRAFVYRDALYVVFNQTPDGTANGLRKIYLGKIDVDYDSIDGYSFHLAGYSRLDVPYPGLAFRAEKNWVPMASDDAIRIVYKSNPLEVYRVPESLLDNLAEHRDIVLEPESVFGAGGTPMWRYGEIRGGSPAIPDGRGNYIAFFHSGLESYLRGRYHRTYVMGAYVFEGHAPYAIKAITQEPVLPPGFFDTSYLNLIAFPGGVFEADGILHVSYGVGDEAVYVVDIDKEKLLATMTAVAH